MVRLVFRPYTQIRRTICTSVSLRASTRVSPGFTLFRHSSPSFGSQHKCSYSNLPGNAVIGRCCPPNYLRVPTYHFHSASGFTTQILAHMLDSLVRVSRRADEKHFARKTPGRGRRCRLNQPKPFPSARSQSDPAAQRHKGPIIDQTRRN